MKERILLQLEMAGALAVIDIRGASVHEEEALRDFYATGDVFLQCNPFTAFYRAVKGSCFEVLVPEVAREMTILLALNEEALDAAIDKSQQIYPFTVFHKLLRD